MVAAPKAPSGQGRAAPGSPAKKRADPRHRAGEDSRGGQQERRGGQGQRAASGTAAVPRSVTGGTSAAAATFAGSAYARTAAAAARSPDRRRAGRTGGRQCLPPAQRGTAGGSQSMMRRPVTTMPSVARTESRNPKLVDRTGSASSRPMTARHRKLSPRPARPTARDARPMPPMSGGPQDTGIRSHHEDEQRQPRETGRGGHRARQAQAAGGQQQRPQDQAAVGAADGGQVRHPDRLHGGFQLRVQGAGVAGDHAGQQPAGVAPEPCRRGGEGAAELTGTLLPGPGSPQQRRSGRR